MKKLCLVAVVAIPLLASSAFADMKIGVVNIQTVLQKSPENAKITAELKSQFQPREKKIEAAQNSFKNEVITFEKNKAVMKAADLQATQQKLMKEQQDLQQMQVAFQQDFMQAQNKLGNAFIDKVKAAIDQVAQDGKYNIVLTSTNTLTNSAVAFSDSQSDITSQVMKDLADQ